MVKKVLKGSVVSASCDRTVLVEVKKSCIHPKYKKIIIKSVKYCAHDESNLLEVGSLVKIESCKPISKNKKWIVVD